MAWVSPKDNHDDLILVGLKSRVNEFEFVGNSLFPNGFRPLSTFRYMSPFGLTQVGRDVAL